VTAKTVIHVRELAKRFDGVQAVAGVDFDVVEGEVFGLLGPNGAGKTTTINMLTGLARADGGTIRIAGIDCSSDARAAQHLVGVVPDSSNLYPELTGFENLVFCGALYGMRKRAREGRARELLDRFGLAEAGGRKFGGCSNGMKRRLTIAAGIMHAPPILFLDEPTTGIDVAGARQIRRLLTETNAAGTTILLTTHYIEEAERLCRRIGFIVEGRIVRVDTVENLLRETAGEHAVELVVGSDAQAPAAAISAAFPALRCRPAPGGSLHIESSEPIRIGPLVRFVEERGVEAIEVRRMRPSLEEVFVRITGIEASAMKQDKAKAAGRMEP
jgi:ABC-2 type transport system ATP-binding protein